MKGKYENLKKKYPEYLSLDQFYRICRIAKRSARYLVEHGIVPAVDTGRKTWRYQIHINDVITYLRRREQWGSMIPPGAVSSRPLRPENPRTSFSTLVKPGHEMEVYHYFEQLYANHSDVLNTQEIVAMTGLSDKTVLLLLKSGEIKSITSLPRYIVPKIYVYEFVATSRYIYTQSNSQAFRRLIEGFEEWLGVCCR
jgi:hypothetical protein